MQGNRSTNTKPEVLLRSALHRSGLRFFKNRRPTPNVSCRVDILFPGSRLAVFVDGCFWHGCTEHGTQPKVNSDWWKQKFVTNRARDERNDRELHAAGWRVLHIWEHEPVDQAVVLIKNALSSA
jgi:DNA mismatch endonuclease, patch repair protein